MALDKTIVKRMTISTIFDAGQTHAFISDVPNFKDYGCAKLKKFTYSLGEICVSYEKLVVDAKDKKQQLNGTQFDNRLVGFVQIKSKKFGEFKYYDIDAHQIIDVIERFDDNLYQR